MKENRRLGTFIVSSEMIENYPEIVKQIMGECIIVRAGFSYIEDAIEYTAISDWFDAIPINNVPMKYNIIFVKDGNNIKWSFGSGAR